MILAEEVTTTLGIFYRGAIVEVTDTKRLQACALAGEIEYCNPNQVGLFDV